VGAAVQRSGKSGGGGGGGEVGVGEGAPHGTHGVGAAVLLMVGVEDEEDVERAREHGIGDVLGLHHLPQHVHEIGGVAKVIVGINVGIAATVAIAVAGDGWNFADEAQHLVLANRGIVDLLGFWIHGGKRGDGAGEHAHGVGV